MFKYNMEDVNKLVGDEENIDNMKENGEELIDKYNAGDTGVINRLVDAVTGEIQMDGKVASLAADDELEFDGSFRGKVAGVATVAKTMADAWTGKIYSLLIQGDNTRLFYDSATKYKIETIVIKDENENVVATEDIVAMMEKDGDKWVANESVMEYCYERLMKRFINK